MGQTVGEDVFFSEQNTHEATFKAVGGEACVLQIPLKDFLAFGGHQGIGKGGGDGFQQDFEVLLILLEKSRELKGYS